MSSVFAGRNAWVAAAVGAAGVLVIGYCVYFDAKRRREPNFKKNLREKRKRIRQEKTAEKTGPGVIPDLQDDEAVIQFIIEAIQRADDSLAGGRPRPDFVMFRNHF